jgi:hypothetical protein
MKSVDFSHDHTLSGASVGSVDSLQRQSGYGLSSIVASPFKSFTNFMPHTWANPPLPAVSLSSQSIIANRTNEMVVAKATCYVSRQKQLRKLQLRMEVEGVVPMSSSVAMGCRSCDGALVFI